MPTEMCTFGSLVPCIATFKAKVLNMAVCSQEENPEGNGWCSIKRSGDGADFEKEARAAEMRARPHYEADWPFVCKLQLLQTE